MNLVERAKNILLQPKLEWPKIEAEATDAKTLYTQYAMILAAIPPIAMLLSRVIYFGGVLGAVVYAIVSYALSLVAVYIVGLIINALAPSFGAQKSPMQALKVAVYASTAGWIGGIFVLLPAAGGILALIAGLYGIYLLYTGLPVLMKVPKEKAVAYTVVVIICMIVLWIVIGIIAGLFLVIGATTTVPRM